MSTPPTDARPRRGEAPARPDASAAATALRTTGDGVVLPVRVIPRATHSELAGARDGMLLVRLTAAPADGAANAALVKLLAKQLGVAQGRIRIVGGERVRRKRVLIVGLTADAVLERLRPTR